MNDQGELSISTERHDKGTVLCINGRVDGTNADTLEGIVRDQLEAGQSALAFDFTNLSYMSSAGLRVLLIAARECHAKRGKCVSFGLSKTIADLFEISGFDRILNVRASRGEALGSI